MNFLTSSAGSVGFGRPYRAFVKGAVGGSSRLTFLSLKGWSTIAVGKSRRAGTPPTDGAATEPPDPESSDFLG